MVMGSRYFYGDRAVYMCPPGLNPATSPILTCRQDGTWDHQPLCKGKVSGAHGPVRSFELSG
jgi:hypothetical protein